MVLLSPVLCYASVYRNFQEPSPSYHPTAEELAQSDDKGSDDDTALTGEENDEGVFIPEDGGSNEANPTQALSA